MLRYRLPVTRYTLHVACTTHYALRSTHYAVRITQYAVRITLCSLCLLLLFSVAACRSEVPDETLWLSGTIEGTKAVVIAEISGRVVEIAADEGEAVQRGQVIMRLDDAAFRAQVKQAQAAVSAAEANLAQVRAGARPEEVAAAQAALDQAQAERDGAQLAYQDALAILNEPQQIQAQLDAARTAARLAEQKVTLAQSKLAEARWWREFYEDDPGRHEALDKQIAIAQRELEAAQAGWAGAQAQVRSLEAMRRAPLALQTQVNSALSTYSMTVASVTVAEATLAELRAGPRPEEVVIAEARLHQAQAHLKLAQAQLERATLYAPLSGVVTNRSVSVGETVQAGVPLVTIVNLDEVTLVVYVPQEYLPRVQLGAPVQVHVDAYPGETFQGEIVYIARRAQFSSRDTQAREDRANVVFAVKVRLPNADHRLKAGMPADCELRGRE